MLTLIYHVEQNYILLKDLHVFPASRLMFPYVFSNFEVWGRFET